MNIAEAKQQLMDLADGEYHTLKYEIFDHGKGVVSQKCTVYVNGSNHFDAPHWESALSGLEESMKGRPVISEDLPVSVKEEKNSD